MEDYLIGIGKRIKEIRKENNMTINDIATIADVTNGLISRIENGRSIPSLPVFLKIINALEIDAAEFFKGIASTRQGGFVICRKDENSIVEKEEQAEGFIYKYIFGKQLNSLGFETVLLEVLPNSKREKITTDAFEYKYILSGECYYYIGDEQVLLKEGDAIYFDGRIPHVPINRSNQSAKMLVVYFYI